MVVEDLVDLGGTSILAAAEDMSLNRRTIRQ
jgi:hypothetical protein